MNSAAHASRGWHAPRVRDARAWGVLVLLSGVFVVSAWWRPADLPALTLCPFRALTGLPCPGCGMTRAFCALGHGEWRDALRYNALSPFVLLALLVLWARALATVLDLGAARALLERLRPGPATAGLLLALTLAWWAARLAAGL